MGLRLHLPLLLGAATLLPAQALAQDEDPDGIAAITEVGADLGGPCGARLASADPAPPEADPAALALATWHGRPLPVRTDWTSHLLLPGSTERTRLVLMLDRTTLMARSQQLELRLVVDELRADALPQVDLHWKLLGVGSHVAVDGVVRNVLDTSTGRARDPSDAERLGLKRNSRFQLTLKARF